MSFFCNRFLYVLLLVGSLSALAAESGLSAFKLDSQKGDIYKPKGLWPLIGVGLGAMDHNDTSRTGGVPGHVKILGSYYFEQMPNGSNWVADLGLGLHNEFLTQQGSGSDTIQSFYSELAGRYVFTNRWQLGAIWNTLIDNPHRYQSNNENLASFIGAQALKEFTYNDEYLVRVGGRAMTSMGLNGGPVNTVMAELQVSFGNGAKVAAVEPAAPVAEPSAAVAPHLAEQAMRSFHINTKLVHFDTNSVHMTMQSAQYFKRLSRSLADNQHLFERVTVVGYTDQRGTERYNYKLSVRRAKVISEKLIAAGVKSSHIKEEGKGETGLLSHSMKPAALLLNRRVRLEFHGVKNQEALKNVVDSAIR